MINVRVTVKVGEDKSMGKYIIDIMADGVRFGGTEIMFSNDESSDKSFTQAEHDATCYLRGLQDGMAALRYSMTFDNGMVGLMDAIRERHKLVKGA